MDALWPVIAGGLIAVAGGIVGAWIQGVREHRRWLRQERLDAYSDFLKYVERHTWEHRTGRAPKERTKEEEYEVRAAMSRLSLLGPRKVDDATRLAVEGVRLYVTGKVPFDHTKPLVAEMAQQMRRAIGVRRWTSLDVGPTANE